ncbi:ABC transporter substrate-binding protein [Beijerinckiaceae bacterium RH AL1]|nr:ABC transporter substrate-binding protein [Beijerinckiaceae bacterium]VVC56075.1 ABC transporter substrate-binding protein [Beijerinckiaceae bacterium RH AL1]
MAGAAALAATARARAEAPATSFKVGTLAFGTVHWVMETIRRNGFDTAQGFAVAPTLLASSEAARIAFLGGSVDTIVNDIFFAARLKAEGRPLQFLPFSSTEGALIAKPTSTIRDVGDLKGKSIGVSGGPLDKNWLILRADAQKSARLDLAKDARPAFGAPPLLAAKVDAGELDCGLLYWSDAARLEAKGFRRVLDTESIVARLGAPGRVAIGGFLLHPETSPATRAGFAKAVRRANDLLANEPKAWDPLRPLMRAPDEATFQALKAAYLRGVPTKPRAAEIADAQAFFAVVAGLGGAALVGEATSLPADLYVDAAALN